MSEDLRPELPSYGRRAVVAPNIERIAAKGVVFDIVGCQVAICAPSRTSMLTGLSPDTLGIYDFFHFGGTRLFRTIPSHFHRHGYNTAMSGKVFHWESDWHYSFRYYGSPDWENTQREEMKHFNSSVTPDSVHSEEGFYRDSLIVEKGIEFLRALNDRRGEPFFLAIGLKGTHMQYQMPHRFWKQYDNANFTSESYGMEDSHLKFPPTAPLLHHVVKTESTAIVYMKEEGRRKGGEVEHYQAKGFGRSISKRGWEELYKGYLGCLSYADYQLGKLLDVVDQLSLWENTIVVFTADHGMHLGEKGIWGKWTLFDEASRVPLLIHDPSSPGSYGKHYSRPVELVDVFPTLVELSGVALEEPCPKIALTDKRMERQGPRDPVQGEAPAQNRKHVYRHVFCDPLDGESLAPAIRQKDGEISFRKKKKNFALTQRLTCKFAGRNRVQDNDPRTKDWIDFCPFKKIPRDPSFGAMGYSARFESWRYILWLEFDVSTFLPSLHLPPMAEELYDHRMDNIEPSSVLGRRENENLAYNNEYTEILISMRVELYDYLWYNASFEHLFQRRASMSRDMRSIIAGRFSQEHGPHPHRSLYPIHHYGHLSRYAKSLGEDPSSLNLLATHSGLHNRTAREAWDMEQMQLLELQVSEWAGAGVLRQKGMKRKRQGMGQVEVKE